MRQTGKYNNAGEMAPDWNAITEATARQLKGEPNARLSSRRELRWGSRGSFKLTIKRDRTSEAGTTGKPARADGAQSAWRNIS